MTGNPSRRESFKVGDKVQFRYTPHGKLKFGQILEIGYASIIDGKESKREKIVRIQILGEKRKYPIKNYTLRYKGLERAKFNPSERCSR
jgi:hypothetical protein